MARVWRTQVPQPHLGKPQAILPLPTQREQTIKITLAGRARLEQPRRFRYSSLGRPRYTQPVSTFIAPPIRIAWVTQSRLRNFAKYRLQRPIAILPLPSLRVQTVKVTQVAVRTAREWFRQFPRQGWDGGTTRQTGTTGVLGGQWRLLGPKPPTIVLPLPTLREQTIKATLSGRTQREAVRRAPHYRLGAPQKILPLPTLREQTAKTTFVQLDLRRRAARSRLSKPAVIATTSFVAPTIRVTLVAVQTRQGWPARFRYSSLGRPQYVQPAAGFVANEIQVVRVTQSRIRNFARSALRPPQVVLPLPTLREQTIRPVLAKLDLRRRGPHSALRPPATLTAAAAPFLPAAIRITTVAVETRQDQPRRVRFSSLGRPQRVQPAPGVVYPPISTRLVAVRTAREKYSRALVQHIQVTPELPLPPALSPIQATILVGCEAVATANNRYHRIFRPARLTRPTVIGPAFIAPRVRVILAGRTRTETVRRAPHSRLPLVLQPPGPPIPSVLIKLRMRMGVGL